MSIAPDDKGNAGRSGPQTRRERREAEHELKVLRDQQEGAERDKETKDIDHKGSAKCYPAEHAQVDEGLSQSPLSP